MAESRKVEVPEQFFNIVPIFYSNIVFSNTFKSLLNEYQ